MGVLQSVVGDSEEQTSLYDYQRYKHLNSVNKLNIILQNWIRANELNVPYEIFPIALFSAIIQFIYQSTFDIDLSSTFYHDLVDIANQIHLNQNQNQSKSHSDHRHIQPLNKQTEHTKIADFKVVIIGNTNVGKTTIAQKWLYGDSSSNYDDRFEYGYYSRKEIEIKIDEKTSNRNKYGICLWDTRGSTKFHRLTKVYARNANAIIFVYDITNKESFNHLSAWIEEVDKANKYPQNVMKVLIANKYDLYLNDNENEHKKKELVLAKKYDINKIWHLSAIEDNGDILDDIFNDITKLILANNNLCIKRRKYPFFG